MSLSIGSQPDQFDPKQSKILVVGAGGIGCEVLKNLCLGGFREIVVVDLDTIDVSNLNRQFLFRREHVSKSKAEVAVISVKSWFDDDVPIKAFHGSIMDSSFNIPFFKGFDVVINALDNVEARRHVNRMCLAADVPLVESGSAGYLGQASCIIKGLTECYECTPKATPKKYPVCSIRSTPTKPIHCIVWAKMLFGRLFGERENDEHSVSAIKGWIERDGVVCVEEMFDTVFVQDIEKLRKMVSMWKTRRKPEPLKYTAALNDDEKVGDVWSLSECADVFRRTVLELVKRPNKPLDFNKDDDDIMDFVTAVAIVREHCFDIYPRTSPFEAKAMAGNIVPAIASTNAVVAGLAVIEAIKILGKNFENVRTTYVRKEASGRRLLMAITIPPPNKQCYVCQHPCVQLSVNTKRYTLSSLITVILKQNLGFCFPSVTVGSSEIYASGDDLDDDEKRDYEEMACKTLYELGICDGVTIACQDFAQDYSLKLTLVDLDTATPDADYKIEGGGRSIEYVFE